MFIATRWLSLTACQAEYRWACGCQVNNWSRTRTGAGSDAPLFELPLPKLEATVVELTSLLGLALSKAYLAPLATREVEPHFYATTVLETIDKIWRCRQVAAQAATTVAIDKE